jgi:hypothetical protein
MTLVATLRERLADWRPHAREKLTVGEDGWTVELSADCVDRVGCALWELAVRPTAPRPLGDLRGWAGHVAARTTGLLEPLTVLEVDAERACALLRSATPARCDDELQYYELLVQGDGGGTLRRYQAPRPGQPRREQTPFTLTHEALAKLVGNLSAA